MRCKVDALALFACISFLKKTEMSPSVRRIVIEGPHPCTSLVLAIAITMLFLRYCEYHHPSIVEKLTGIRLFEPNAPAPCKLFSTEKPNQCPKWLATQFMRQAIDSQYRFVKGGDQCWHRNRNYMIDALHKYYYASELFTVFTRYVIDDMGAEKSADVMSLI